MRTFRPGEIALPLTLLLAGVAMTLNNLAIIQVTEIWSLWPVLLIASGLEELYFWAFPERMRRNRQ